MVMEGFLPILREVDAVGQELAGEPGHDGERADVDAFGAIDEVPIGEGGVGVEDEFRPAAELVLEMALGAGGKAGDPVEIADESRFSELDEVDVLARAVRWPMRALSFITSRRG